MNWIEVLLNTINEYSLLLIVILSTTNITFALFADIRDKKSFKIAVAGLSIFILLLSSAASIYESKKIEKHYFTAINTFINTDSLIDKAKRNSQLINDNLVLSKDLSDKTTEVSKNTLKIFDELTEKDSYCYIDVNPFLYPVRSQKEIVFCIKHVGNVALRNVTVIIENTSNSFLIRSLYRTGKELPFIENLTINSIELPVIYPNSEKTISYKLDTKLDIPMDTSKILESWNDHDHQSRLRKMIDGSYITLQIEIFTQNKNIVETIAIENYSDLKKRKILISVYSQGELLKEINY